ncbi:Uridine kinase-like protein 5 [Striga hermonthica]|uniref:Uridine kinase n=1 Tax=Striga hermonthica TaxID=68872 RepID=A0A9N7N0C8_STRHE|nr:Uridine kinase-like protein 5 [Striga hermonthica]
MDSDMAAALRRSVENHFSPRSNGGSDPVPLKLPFIIGVAGGTASGKTTVCNMIISQLHDQRVVLVNQDAFYRSLTNEQLPKVSEYNFDHPGKHILGFSNLTYAFDTDLLLSCMEKLRRGRKVSIPNYDFKTHQSVEPARMVNPSDVIILEGILVLHDSRVRDLMNMKIFVDTDSDVRLARRIQRDTVERGRNVENVLDQYAKFVKPSFEEFILPSKKHADVIIPRGADNDVALDLIGLTLTLNAFQVVEHGLGHLPFTEKQIITPTGSVYCGVVFCKRLCGVSIIRSGESMENALRACCKGIKIGKILIHGEGNNGRQLIYEKLPSDIASRHVLLLDPVLASGNSAIKAISVLLNKGVPESNIIFLNLIAAPEGIHTVCKKFPRLKIVTSEIDMALNVEMNVIPGMGEFGDRYFGTGSSRREIVPK